MTATLYIEGGGDGRSLLGPFREGWREFLRSAGVDGRVKVVRGGGREQTYRRFVTAAASAGSSSTALLLVDSEDPVAAGHTVWQHLAARDRWTRPDGVGDDQAFLMVQVMETWFLADCDALRAYFGREFRKNAIPARSDLEGVPKATVFKALKRATGSCRQSYTKGRVSFELLARIDPACVETTGLHAQAFLNRLRLL